MFYATQVRVREEGVIEAIRRVPIGSGVPLSYKDAALKSEASPTPTKLIACTVTLSEI